MQLRLSELDPRERYRLLIGSVIPRPIALISTTSANGVTNCAPFSFFNVVSDDPPLCAVSFNRRSDGDVKHTLKNIRRTGSFVVNLVDEAIANGMHLASAELPEERSELDEAGFTAVPAVDVPHPRVVEAPISLECRVFRRLELGRDREIVLGEVLRFHARDDVIDPVSKRVRESAYRPVGRLFGNRYCTTRERFDLPGRVPD